MTDLDRVFQPESVAVVGASETEGKRGHRTLLDLLEGEFDGAVYPINPSYDELLGEPAYPTVSDVPDRVDLAFVAIPAPGVPDVIRDCGDAGVAGAVVTTAGFGETGNDDLEADLLAAAREGGVSIVGPNVQGVLNNGIGLDLLNYEFDTPPGSIGLVTQSGNVGLDVTVDAADRGTAGFSLIVGVGNELDLEFADYLSYLADHGDTDVVAVYAEGMEDGRSFLQAASRASTETPVVAFKTGRSEAGKASARSHTASVAGDHGVIDAAYRQAGVAPVDEIDLVVPVAETLGTLPTPDGDGVAVLTDGGGHGTIAVDALAEAGLSVPSLTERTRDRLRESIPQSPNLSNPVDVMGYFGQRTMWYECARTILDDPNVDQLLYTGAVGGYDDHWYGDVPEEVEMATDVGSLVAEYDVPIVVHSIFTEVGSAALEAFGDGGVPVHESISDAVACLRALTDYGRHCRHADEKSDFVLPADRTGPAGSNADSASTQPANRPPGADGTPDPTEHDRENEGRESAESTAGEDPVSAARAAGRSTLSESESRRLVESYGVPTVPVELARSAEEAVGIAAGYDRAVALKVDSPDLPHRSGIGGVELDCGDESEVRAAYRRVLDAAESARPDASIEGVLVSPMVDDGVEFLVGATTDPEVGPIVTVGLGGVLVESLDTTASRALPLTEFDARELIAEFRAQELLDGPRGLPAVDRAELAALLRNVSELFLDVPEVGEMDLNPVVATDRGLFALDASVHLRDRPGDSISR